METVNCAASPFLANLGQSLMNHAFPSTITNERRNQSIILAHATVGIEFRTSDLRAQGPVPLCQPPYSFITVHLPVNHLRNYM